MKTRHIIGLLVATKPEAVTVRTRRRIYDAVVAAGLYTLVSPAKWEEGIVKINHTATIPTEDDSALEFITKLKDMLWRVGVTELGLTGEIVITVTGTEPTAYRVVVEDSALTYTKAIVAWAEPVKL